MSSGPEKTINAVLKRLREEILPMFEKALSNNACAAFDNPHLISCSTLECKSDACVLHKSAPDGVRCWQVEAACCGAEHQGDLKEKRGECFNCKVFKGSCPTIVEELGEHYNNMMFLLGKQKKELLKDKELIEHLNRELISALEQIDAKNREIQKMMITDKLTGLYNRHHLISVLEDEIARCNRYGHPFAVMMIDIDNFRSINDNYGQSAGDAMLEYVGGLIKENTRKFDRSFRYGGEEFIVVLPETDITLAYIVAERIRKGFEAKTFKATKRGSDSESFISRTLSIGITASFPYKTNEISIEELLNQSDKALYLAKNKGGNASVRYE
ncbi:MAG: GGDEF domain-containing protein [Nitrospirae bacterium]|nr:GGDEF domain-containing protein [Nitrospirota bacterium]